MSPTISTPRRAADHVRSTRRVRLALWWARLFARLAGSGVTPGVRQEIHAELAALHFELAAGLARRGQMHRSRAAFSTGQAHARASMPPDLPPAAASSLARHALTRAIDARAAGTRSIRWP